MNPKNKLYSIAAVATVFLFGSLGAPTAKWMQAHRAAASPARIAATIAAHVPTLPVAGLAR